MSAHATLEISSPDTNPNEELQESAFAKRRCCFWLPCFGSSQSGAGWGRIPTTETEESERPWWSKGFDAFMKVREWSELVAGPKWKTFIRRLNRNRNKPSKFRYDPLSYALNFDEGQNGPFEDNDRLYRDFSSRYAALPVSSKSSMELGKDPPSFT